MELAKVQLQNQTLSTHMKGPIDCLAQLYERRGVRGCFTGMAPTVLRELSFGPYFVTYECISRLFGDRNITGPKVIFAGGIAGMIAWCSTYPAGNNLHSYRCPCRLKRTMNHHSHLHPLIK